MKEVEQTETLFDFVDETKVKEPVKIKIELKDWLFNAGVVGFVNILKHAECQFEFNNHELVFNPDVLDNFEEKYFKYFIDTYEKSLAWYKIIIIESFISKHLADSLCNFSKESLVDLNDYIRILKDKNAAIKESKKYLALYHFLEIDPIAIKKNLSIIKIGKGEELKDKTDEIKYALAIIQQIIRLYKNDRVRKYFASLNAEYSIINNALSEVSFLNPQTKEIDMFIDYKTFFLKEAQSYNDADKSKYKYKCFACDSNMKNLSNDLGFLNMTGFDTTRKPSHVWNFVNDIAICPICKLIYSCIPAGFAYVYGHGIYINENHSVENAVRINNRIKTEILNDSKMDQNTTYKALITSIQEVYNQSAKYELADIQIVRYENDDGNKKYRFNILSKKVLTVLNESKDDLNHLIKAGYKEVKTYFRIYEEVMKKLLNNENLFLLIHKMLIMKVSGSNDAHFSEGHILNILKINTKYLKGIGCMENIPKEKDIVDSARGAGYWLKEAYKNKNSENKLNGISYRLLNSLKTNNRGSFMDTLLNCYLYTGKEVPLLIVESLKGSNENFKTIGYAFAAGLIDGTNYKDENKQERV